MNDQYSTQELRLLSQIAEKHTKFSAAVILQIVELRAMLATIMDLQRLSLHHQTGLDVETLTTMAQQAFEQRRTEQERLVRESLGIVEMAQDKPDERVM